MADADTLRARITAALGDRYAIERELGGGGMSRVFVATETALGRSVVIKTLPDDLAASLSAERFDREIRLVASLQQANIVPVLASGTAGGVPWYTMPFVDGESLRARLGTGPLAEGEAVSVLRDVCRALAFAHDRGIVHRDIKPDNILLSGDAAVVTDFGIAKAVRAARDEVAIGATLTSAGVSLGTPAYMAPEQVTGDETTDHRADLYALGCVAFELVAGQPPFVAKSPSELVRAHLATPPPALRSVVPGITTGYAALVSRLLAKEPAGRPASAREVLRQLDTIGSPVSGGTTSVSLPRAVATWAAATVATYILARAAVVGIGLPDWTVTLATGVAALGLPAVLTTWWVQRTARRAAVATPRRTPGGSATQGTLAGLAIRAEPIVTWRRTRRAGWLALGGVAAAVILTMALRPFGIGPAASLRGAGRVAADSRVLIAAFSSSTGDSTLGEALTQAMRTALGSSTSLVLMRPAEVGQVLRQMTRDPATVLTSQVAREVAQRAGVPLLVEGRVATAGNGFLVTVQLVSADSGQVLATFQRGANSADDLLAAVDRVARDLRSRVGESLRDVARAPALEAATTTSLPALRAYSRGVQLGDVQGDFAGGLDALLEAVRLDSTFASAWRKAAAYSFNVGAKRSATFAYAAAAYRHRDRVAGDERAAVEAYYMGEISTRQAERLYADMKGPTQINRAVRLRELGEFAAAESVALRELSEDSATGRPHTVQGAINLASAQINQGKMAEARSTYDLARRVFGNAYYVQSMRASLAWSQWGVDSLDAFVWDTSIPRSANLRSDVALMRASVAGMRGQLRAYGPLMDASAAAGTGVSNFGEPVDAAVTRIVTDAVHRRREREGLVALDSLLRARPQEGLPALDRRDVALAEGYAKLGRPDRGAALLAGLERQLTRDERLARWGELRVTAGEIALAQGRAADAIAAFREAASSDSGSVEPAWSGRTNAGLARAFDKAGATDSARARYEHIADRFGGGPWAGAPLMLPLALRRLGELAESKGDVATAITRYRAFVALWRNADPELQPQVADVKARIARLEARESRGR